MHPDDFDRCAQHYIRSFERRIPFAMSYRLQHHTGEYFWILDRGAPHYTADGEFLGFYGGCAELSAIPGVSRMAELREALQQMRDFATLVAQAEGKAIFDQSRGAALLKETAGRNLTNHHARQNAAAQIGKLAADMLTFDRIENGACLH